LQDVVHLKYLSGLGFQTMVTEVRTRSNGFAFSGTLLNRGLNFRSGSAISLNFGLNLGLVLKSSGSNFGSELDCGIANGRGSCSNDKMMPCSILKV
jgi:hypothetical protein